MLRARLLLRSWFMLDIASFRRSRWSVALLATSLALSIACSDSTSADGPAVARIEAIPSKLDLLVGETKVITARAVDAAGAPVARKLFWSSSTPTVATVTQEGIVTAVAPGSTEVAVSGGGKSTVVPVTVAGRPAALLRVTPASTSLRVGESSSLTAEVLDATGAVIGGRTITWSSSNTAVATVNTNGVVTAVGAGTSTITATSGSVSGIAVVSVQLVPVASLVVAPTTAALLAGEALQLTAEARDAADHPLPNRNVTWTTSAPTFATVSSTGFVIALAPGTATITAHSEGKSATARITIAAVPVANVTVIPGAVTVAVKQTAQLVARITDSTGATLNGRSTTWSSSAPTVATVDNDGTVTAIATGTARISATSEGKSGSANVTVTPVPVASIDLTPATLSLIEGETQQLTARVRDAQGNVLSGRLITYISGAPAVATVDATGIVTAVGPGSALIIATSEGARATTAVTVVAASVAKVAVSPTTGNLLQGEALQLTAAITDTRGLPMAGKTATWTSSNPTVATVGNTGLVRAVTPGTTTITATSDGVSGTATISVALVPVANVTLAPSPAAVFTGRTLQLAVALEDAKGNPLSTAGRTITWTSSAPSIATVSNTGVVTGTTAGSATVTASVSGVNGTVPVNVTDVPVASVAVSPTTTQLTVGGSAQLTATARDASGNVITGRPVTWSSSDASIATVSNTGLASALAAGTAQLTATIGGAHGSATLTVIVVPVASVTVAPATSTIAVGATVQLSATAQDAGGNTLAGRLATWASSNTSVATVDANGLVTAVSSGSASVTVTIEGKSATSAITVTAVPVASVAVTPATATVTEGATTTLTATSKDAQGNTLSGRAVTWTTSDAAIATVSPTGVVTGVAAGTATITATDASGGGGSGAPAGSSTVTVNPAPVLSIVIAPNNPTITVGATVTLTATLFGAVPNVPLPIVGRTITWTTSNSAVATVTPNGVVSGVSAGNATITVSALSIGQATAVSSSVTVSVAAASTSSASRVSITPVHGTVHIGTAYARQVNAQVFDLAGAPLPNEIISWRTSAPKSLQVASTATGQSATITAVGSPSAAIRLIASTTSARPVADTITISSDLVTITAVTIAPTSLTLVQGATQAVTATALDSAGNAIGSGNGNPLGARSTLWSTGDRRVATVSRSGVITAGKKGTTTIDVLIGGVGPATLALTVTTPAGSSIVSSIANATVDGASRFPNANAGCIFCGSPHILSPRQLNVDRGIAVPLDRVHRYRWTLASWSRRD